jgi:hypothetical protein
MDDMIREREREREGGKTMQTMISIWIMPN